MHIVALDLHRTDSPRADALEIEAAAKRRLADEYDAVQERGEDDARQVRDAEAATTPGFRPLDGLGDLAG